ncbi:hypothetical protein K8T06_08730, partial [bacterium]|nr:hypothetical protein [bacterium]
MNRFEQIMQRLRSRTVVRDIVVSVVVVASLVVLVMGFLNYAVVVDLAENEHQARLDRINLIMVRRLGHLMMKDMFSDAAEFMREAKKDLQGSILRLEDETGKVIYFSEDPEIKLDKESFVADHNIIFNG